MVSRLKRILIYNGAGTSVSSLEGIINTLQQLRVEHNISLVNSEIIKRKKWIQKTALLIMPGGVATPYMQSLEGEGNRNIREYVFGGGKYLGICAGAYYASSQVEYAIGNVQEQVVGERELKFFPGKSSGPLFPCDDPSIPKYDRAKAVSLTWRADDFLRQNKSVDIFYNGGGSFEDIENFPNVEVLAYYCAKKYSALRSRAAIIECSVGKGKATLSGVHVEWSHKEVLSISDSLIKLKSDLEISNEDRLYLARYLFDRLGIAFSDKSSHAKFRA